MPTDSDIIKAIQRILDALKPKPKKHELMIVVGPVGNKPVPPPPPEQTLQIIVGPAGKAGL